MENWRIGLIELFQVKTFIKIPQKTQWKIPILVRTYAETFNLVVDPSDIAQEANYSINIQFLN